MVTPKNFAYWSGFFYPSIGADLTLSPRGTWAHFTLSPSTGAHFTLSPPLSTPHPTPSTEHTLPYTLHRAHLTLSSFHLTLSPSTEHTLLYPLHWAHLTLTPSTEHTLPYPPPLSIPYPIPSTEHNLPYPLPLSTPYCTPFHWVYLTLSPSTEHTLPYSLHWAYLTLPPLQWGKIFIGVLLHELKYLINWQYFGSCFVLQREKYYGDRGRAALVKYALKEVNAHVSEIWSGNFETVMQDEEKVDKPWVISFCGDGGGKHPQDGGGGGCKGHSILVLQCHLGG